MEATEWEEEEEVLGWKGAEEGTKAGAEEEVVGGLKVAGGVAEKASGV